MPLKGWICPAHGEEEGRTNEFDYCVTQCSKPCVAAPVLQALKQVEQEDTHVGKRISVTMLTAGCKRKTLLERNVSYYLDPSWRIPTFRGTLIHSIIEKAAKELTRLPEFPWEIELSMALPVETESGKWILNGMLDAFDPRTLTIYDLKTLQEYAIFKMVTGGNPGMWSSHIPEYYVKQLNLYRLMAKTLELFEAKHLRLQIVTFGDLVLTGTTRNHRFKKGFKWVEEEYELPDVPILDDDTVRHWITTEGDEWFRILYLNEPAPVCSHENSWLCKKCPFFETEHCPNPDEERME